MKIQGLIQAAGNGSRLGLGPKAFITLGGQTLMERAIAMLMDVTDSVIVAVPADRVDMAQDLVANSHVRVIEGGSTRSMTTHRLLKEATAPWLLLHDVVHPFATRELVQLLLEAAYECGAAAPAIRNSEYAYDINGHILHAPGDILVGQKPVALSREAVMSAYQKSRITDTGKEPSLIEVLEQSGIRARFIAGSTRNLKITEPADLELAQALHALEKI